MLRRCGVSQSSGKDLRRIATQPNSLELVFQIAGRAPLAALPSGIDWQTVEQCARHVQLFPLFARRILDFPGSALPAGVAERWKNLLREHTAATLVLINEHRRLTPGFAAAGLQVIPVKGPALAEQLYGEASLRDYVDLDYVIPAEQLAAGCEVLERAGYQPETHRPGSPAFQAMLPMMDHHVREIRYIQDVAGIAVVVELHWDVFPSTEQIPWTTEAYALYLALHGSRHLWQPLKHLSDLRDWIALHGPAFDWDAYYALARRLQLERVAHVPLLLIRALQGEAVSLREHHCEALWEALVAQRDPEENLWRFHRCRSQLFDTRRERWGYLWGILAPTRFDVGEAGVSGSPAWGALLRRWRRLGGWLAKLLY